MPQFPVVKMRADLETKQRPEHDRQFFDTDAAWRRLAFCSSAEARALLPFADAKRLQVLPLGIVAEPDGTRCLTVAAAESTSQECFKELRFIADADIVVEHIGHDLIAPAITAAYQGQSDCLARRADVANAELQERKPAPPAVETASVQPVPLLLDAVLGRAHYLGSSDIHLERGPGTARLRFRVNGRLQEDTAFRVEPEVADNLVRRVKVLAHLDTTCNFRPQEGAFSHRLQESSMRLRVSIVPQLGGEKLVLRVFDLRPGGRPLSALGLLREQELMLKAHLGAERGAIILTGPTGSGKTTLLYAALEHLNTDWRNIVTLEDPIERVLSGVNQTEVSRAEGLTYAEMLPLVLRQDPDVLMLGEIRDQRTAETAFTAAITGHLVLSTVHAGDCFESFLRFDQLGVDRKLMLTALRIVVSQRLLPVNCGICREDLRAGEQLAALFQIDPDAPVACARGCDRCHDSGISGRIAIFEMLSMNEAICAVLENRPRIDFARWSAQLRECAYEHGFVPLAFHVRQKLVCGEISPHTALRALGIAPELL